MRVAIDLTNSPHVPFFAPLIRRLEAGGHEVVVTARRFAQTVELARLHRIPVEVIGSHGGRTRVGKARSAAQRTWQLTRHLRSLARDGAFDVAMSHGSTDLPLACRWLVIPHVTIFDYEWATTMHRTNVRNSWRVLTPDAIDPASLDRYGAAGKLVQYPGLKEEYYLGDAGIDDTVRDTLGIAAGDLLAVLRPPPELALYHRGHANELFDAVIERIIRTPNAKMVVLPRTPEQRSALHARHGSEASVIIPEHAVDGVSLLAASDLVVSAGGTMNREAVALGVPVYTVFAGRLGGVDAELIRQGRLRRLESADAIELRPRDRGVGTAAESSTGGHTLRDPAILLRLALEGLPSEDPTPAPDEEAVKGPQGRAAGPATV